MRIEIEEKNGKGLKLKCIDESLNEFFDSVEEEYEKSKKRALKSTKAKMLGVTSKINDAMPDFISHIHFIENDRIIVRNNLPFSIMAQKIGSYKKMEKGLESYLKAKGFECQVKVTKDKGQ